MIPKMAAVLLVPVFSFFTSRMAHPVKPEPGDIPWSAERRLTWADFKSNPAERTIDAALTSSKIVFSYGYASRKGFTFNIGCMFDKNNSWGRIKTDYILAHEQGHFDIAEIYARKLNRAMKHALFKPATLAKEVPALYQKIIQEEGEEQNRYDLETDFSRNKARQAEWLETIHEELNSLQAYADYR